MSKTIRQIADEIGVSKQAVYKRFRGKLYKDCYPDSYMENGVLYINEVGERKLKEDFKNGIKKTPLYPPAYRVHTEYSNGALAKTDDNTSENMITKPKNEETIKNNEKGTLQWSTYGAYTDSSNGALSKTDDNTSENMITKPKNGEIIKNNENGEFQWSAYEAHTECSDESLVKSDDNTSENEITKPKNDADDQEDSLNIQGGCSTPCSTPLNELELLKSTIDMLQSTIDMLKNQLDVKDNTIHELTEALKAEQQQTSQAQLLHCGSIKQSLLADQLEKQDNDVNTEKADSPKHVALFDRIFKRK